MADLGRGAAAGMGVTSNSGRLGGCGRGLTIVTELLFAPGRVVGFNFARIRQLARFWVGSRVLFSHLQNSTDNH